MQPPRPDVRPADRTAVCRAAARRATASRTAIRTCVACRQSDGKRALLRMVRLPGGEVVLDPTGKQNGRGAYVCPNEECLEKALTRKQLERSLRAVLSDPVVTMLRSAVAGGPDRLQPGEEETSLSTRSS